MNELDALRKYNEQGNIKYDFKRKYFTFWSRFWFNVKQFFKGIIK